MCGWQLPFYGGVSVRMGVGLWKSLLLWQCYVLTLATGDSFGPAAVCWDLRFHISDLQQTSTIHSSRGHVTCSRFGFAFLPRPLYLRLGLWSGAIGIPNKHRHVYWPHVYPTRIGHRHNTTLSGHVSNIHKYMLDFFITFVLGHIVDTWDTWRTH